MDFELPALRRRQHDPVELGPFLRRSAGRLHRLRTRRHAAGELGQRTAGGAAEGGLPFGRAGNCEMRPGRLGARQRRHIRQRRQRHAEAFADLARQLLVAGDVGRDGGADGLDAVLLPHRRQRRDRQPLIGDQRQQPGRIVADDIGLERALPEEGREHPPEGLALRPWIEHVDHEPAAEQPRGADRLPERALECLGGQLGRRRRDAQLEPGQSERLDLDPAPLGTGQDDRGELLGIAMPLDLGALGALDLPAPVGGEQFERVERRGPADRIEGRIGGQPAVVAGDQPVEQPRVDPQRLVGGGQRVANPLDQPEFPQGGERGDFGADAPRRRPRRRRGEDGAGETHGDMATPHIVVERAEQALEPDIELGREHDHQQLHRQLVALEQPRQVHQRRVRHRRVDEHRLDQLVFLARLVHRRVANAAQALQRSHQPVPGQAVDCAFLALPLRPEPDEDGGGRIGPVQRAAQRAADVDVDLAVGRDRQLGNGRLLAGEAVGGPRIARKPRRDIDQLAGAPLLAALAGVFHRRDRGRDQPDEVGRSRIVEQQGRGALVEADHDDRHVAAERAQRADRLVEHRLFADHHHYAAAGHLEGDVQAHRRGRDQRDRRLALELLAKPPAQPVYLPRPDRFAADHDDQNIGIRRHPPPRATERRT